MPNAVLVGLMKLMVLVELVLPELLVLGLEGDLVLECLLPDLPFLFYIISNLSFNYNSSIIVLLYCSYVTSPC